MIRLSLLLALAVAGCAVQNYEHLIEKCHQYGYFARSRPGKPVQCCSRVNGDDVCIPAVYVTRHRRETGQ